jgi:hypothetical protein
MKLRFFLAFVVAMVGTEGLSSTIKTTTKIEGKRFTLPHAGQIFSDVRLSPDGRVLAAFRAIGGWSFRIDLIETLTGRLMDSITTNLKNSLDVVEFSPDSQFLIATGPKVESHYTFLVAYDFKNRVWREDSYNLTYPEVGFTVFSPRGNQAVLYLTNSLEVIGTNDGVIRFSVKPPCGSFVPRGAFSPDGEKFIYFCGTGDKEIISVYETKTWSLLSSKEFYSHYMELLAFSGDGKTLLIKRNSAGSPDSFYMLDSGSLEYVSYTSQLDGASISGATQEFQLVLGNEDKAIPRLRTYKVTVPENGKTPATNEWPLLAETELKFTGLPSCTEDPICKSGGLISFLKSATKLLTWVWHGENVAQTLAMFDVTTGKADSELFGPMYTDRLFRRDPLHSKDGDIVVAEVAGRDGYIVYDLRNSH